MRRLRYALRIARTCPIGFDVTRLRAEVSATYERVARDPEGELHFHRGMDDACELLGHARAELATLPPETVAPLAGVANPLRIGPIEPGERALPEAERHEIAGSPGLVGGRIVEHFDTFRGTSALDRVSKDLRPHGASFHARKPA